MVLADPPRHDADPDARGGRGATGSGLRRRRSGRRVRRRGPRPRCCSSRGSGWTWWRSASSLSARSGLVLVAAAADAARVPAAGPRSAQRDLARALLPGAYFGGEAFLPLMLVEQRHVPLVLAGAMLTVGAVGWTTGSFLQCQPRLPLRRDQLITIGCLTVALGLALAGVIALRARLCRTRSSRSPGCSRASAWASPPRAPAGHDHAVPGGRPGPQRLLAEPRRRPRVRGCSSAWPGSIFARCTPAGTSPDLRRAAGRMIVVGVAAMPAPCGSGRSERPAYR